MERYSFPPLLLPTTASALPASPLPAGQVEAVTPVSPLAVVGAELESLPVAQMGEQPAPVASQAASDLPEAAAWRPDQAVMARQMTWPTPDGPTLARSWRAMVNQYGEQLSNREQQARGGQLPNALLQSGQDLRSLRQPELTGPPVDAWRFSLQMGAFQAQHLRVVEGEPEPVLGRRRRGRAALRLEVVLDDGSVVVVQAEPFAQGLRLDLCARDPRALERLRDLQPRLQQAVERAGLRVIGWRYRDTLPDGQAHARLPSLEAVAMLTLPVFQALAELALSLPLGSVQLGSPPAWGRGGGF